MDFPLRRKRWKNEDEVHAIYSTRRRSVPLSGPDEHNDKILNLNLNLNLNCLYVRLLWWLLSQSKSDSESDSQSEKFASSLVMMVFIAIWIWIKISFWIWLCLSLLQVRALILIVLDQVMMENIETAGTTHGTCKRLGTQTLQMKRASAWAWLGTHCGICRWDHRLTLGDGDERRGLQRGRVYLPARGGSGECHHDAIHWVTYVKATLTLSLLIGS